jgi:hypothetical protein
METKALHVDVKWDDQPEGAGADAIKVYSGTKLPFMVNP